MSEPQHSPVIDWPGIRAAAVQLGIRGAARQAGADLPPAELERFVFRVLKRAMREKWETARLANQATAPAPSSNAAKPLSSRVLTGAQAVQNALEEDSTASRAAFSRGLRHVAEHFRDIAAKDPSKALSEAPNAKATVSSLSVVHRWEDRQAPVNVLVNVALSGIAPERLVRGMVVEQEGEGVERASTEGLAENA